MTPEADKTVSQQNEGQKNDLDLKGRFARYNSPFLQLMIPVLTTRYVWLAIEDINPLNFLKKPDPALKPDFKPWTKPATVGGYISRNFAALGMGATILSLIGYYSKRTGDDIKTLYSEAVGYELDKKKEDVTWRDVFIKSKNSTLGVTRDAFFKRTAIRVAAGSAFLMPWHEARDFKHEKPKYDANANAGVGAVGIYLSLFEGFLRKQSFFDAEQSMVGAGINHSDTNTHEIIDAKSVQSLMLLQRKQKDPKYEWPQMNSPEGLHEADLALRISSLLNQTYNNIKRVCDANFTIGKFNFLGGFGMLDHFPESAAFVELANKSKDMKDVKAAAQEIRAGQDSAAVFKKYGVDMAQVVKKIETLTDPEPSVAAAKFTDMVPKPVNRLAQGPKSHQEFAEQVITSHQLS